MRSKIFPTVLTSVNTGCKLLRRGPEKLVRESPGGVMFVAITIAVFASVVIVAAVLGLTAAYCRSVNAVEASMAFETLEARGLTSTAREATQ